MSAPEVRMVPLSALRFDPGLQMREQEVGGLVEEYSEALDRGDRMPPIVAYDQGDGELLVVDGYHRARAASLSGRTEIECEVHRGDRRTAVLHAVRVNANHGMPRSNETKRRAVRTLLEDPEWGRWSDREIAKRCRVSHPFVAEVRRRLDGNASVETRRFTTRHGTVGVRHVPSAVDGNVSMDGNASVEPPSVTFRDLDEEGDGLEDVPPPARSGPALARPHAVPDPHVEAASVEAARLERAFVALVDEIAAAPQRVRFALSPVIEDCLPKLQRIARTEAA